MGLPGGRRSFEMVSLPQPARASFGTARAAVNELSINEAAVLLQGRCVAGEVRELRFRWQGEEIAFQAEVIDSQLEKLSPESPAKSIYRTRLALLHPLGASNSALRSLIAEQVMRALDEQKANARGIPVFAANSYQRGGAHAGYLAYRFVGGLWRKNLVDSPEQPVDGFTVSGDENAAEIEVLCRSYEAGDHHAREMIRQLADLSIEAAGGIPTRKYRP
jgi:hypothetical protein